MITTKPRLIRLAALAVGTAIALTACGGSDGDADPAEPASTQPTPAETTPAAEQPAAEQPADDADTTTLVTTGTSDLGEILTNSGGRSLYGFTPDVGGTPTCNDGCAEAWPPISVDSAELPAGLDAEIFSVVQRDDGSNQLAAGGWPLYLFAGDIVPGDVNGQESGGNWFLAAPDGSLIGSPTAAG